MLIVVVVVSFFFQEKVFTFFFILHENIYCGYSVKVPSALNDIKEVNLKDFQYKINNRILTTNSFLYKINKIDSNRCSFCKQTIESIKHLFVDCPKVKEFWNTLKNWLQVNGNINLSITDKISYLLGHMNHP